MCTGQFNLWWAELYPCENTSAYNARSSHSGSSLWFAIPGTVRNLSKFYGSLCDRVCAIGYFSGFSGCLQWPFSHTGYTKCFANHKLLLIFLKTGLVLVGTSSGKAEFSPVKS